MAVRLVVLNIVLTFICGLAWGSVLAGMVHLWWSHLIFDFGTGVNVALWWHLFHSEG